MFQNPANNFPVHNSKFFNALFKLNKVTKGGYTAFPNVNVSAVPRKGSAIVWYNLKPTYEVDTNSLHGACPIFSGTKWGKNEVIYTYVAIYVKTLRY